MPPPPPPSRRTTGRTRRRNPRYDEPGNETAPAPRPYSRQHAAAAATRSDDAVGGEDITQLSHDAAANTQFFVPPPPPPRQPRHMPHPASDDDDDDDDGDATDNHPATVGPRAVFVDTRDMSSGAAQLDYLHTAATAFAGGGAAAVPPSPPPPPPPPQPVLSRVANVPRQPPASDAAPAPPQSWKQWQEQAAREFGWTPEEPEEGEVTCSEARRAPDKHPLLDIHNTRSVQAWWSALRHFVEQRRRESPVYRFADRVAGDSGAPSVDSFVLPLYMPPNAPPPIFTLVLGSLLAELCAEVKKRSSSAAAPAPPLQTVTASRLAGAKRALSQANETAAGEEEEEAEEDGAAAPKAPQQFKGDESLWDKKILSRLAHGTFGKDYDRVERSHTLRAAEHDACSDLADRYPATLGAVQPQQLAGGGAASARVTDMFAALAATYVNANAHTYGRRGAAVSNYQHYMERRAHELSKFAFVRRINGLWSVDAAAQVQSRAALLARTPWCAGSAAARSPFEHGGAAAAAAAAATTEAERARRGAVRLLL